ncbi:MAG TPA: SRPBCC family protein [Gemmatimonadales bacterium]|nr:SRPBCC family protein [Gemmatimonadales bacterium]
MTGTEQSLRYGGSLGERRRANYTPYQTYNRRYTDQPGRKVEQSTERWAKGLGWLSIGLGLAQIAAPRAVARLIGVNDDDETRNTMFALGLREITSGVGILSRPRPVGWVWTRVGGDLMDLALLGKAMSSGDNDRNRVAAVTAAVVGVTLLDVITGQQLSKGGNGARTSNGSRTISRATGPGFRIGGPIQVKEAITINRPRSEVYRFWHNFENLPRFMAHLESVQILDERRSRWKGKAPAGSTVEWEAEIIEDRPNELIAWRSLPDSTVPNMGSVQFRDAPGGRGTEVLVELRYQPPGGKIGALIAKLFGEEPKQQVKGDLRRFKQVMELGEIVHSDSSIHRGPHPAQPPEDLNKVELGTTQQPQEVQS